MSRLIDADALFAEFENVDWYNNADRDEIAERLVLQAPTIDAVSVVHGEWVEDYNNTYSRRRMKCSVCGKFSGIGGIKSNQLKPYCPSCGAHMKGVCDVY